MGVTASPTFAQIKNKPTTLAGYGITDEKCKAWVNFDGTGAVGTNMTIRSSFNVSSVFKNSPGDYTINFTSAMADANYAVAVSSITWFANAKSGSTASSCNLLNVTGTGVPTDSANITLAVFR